VFAVCAFLHMRRVPTELPQLHTSHSVAAEAEGAKAPHTPMVDYNVAL
jgi:hypothetical protein